MLTRFLHKISQAQSEVDSTGQALSGTGVWDSYDLNYLNYFIPSKIHQIIVVVEKVLTELLTCVTASIHLNIDHPKIILVPF